MGHCDNACAPPCRISPSARSISGAVNATGPWPKWTICSSTAPASCPSRSRPEPPAASSRCTISWRGANCNWPCGSTPPPLGDRRRYQDDGRRARALPPVVDPVLSGRSDAAGSRPGVNDGTPNPRPSTVSGTWRWPGRGYRHATCRRCAGCRCRRW